MATAVHSESNCNLSTELARLATLVTTLGVAAFWVRLSCGGREANIHVCVSVSVLGVCVCMCVCVCVCVSMSVCVSTLHTCFLLRYLCIRSMSVFSKSVK